MVKVRLALLAVCVVLITSLGLADDGSGWTIVDRERGITSSQREQPGCCLPSFRGQGVVSGNVLQVLAVMLDIPAVPKWAFGVDEAALLKRINGGTEIVYLYSDVVWPVRDRDMVVARDVDVIKPGEEFTMRLRCQPKARPERDGVVRVPNCRSTFHIRKIDLEHTEIDYVMSLDPGGHLPDWVSGWVSKHVPFKTLVAIESTAADSKGRYEAVRARWSSAM